MKFEEGQILKWYQLGICGWLDFTHFCNDPNKNCIKDEEYVKRALTAEMFLKDFEVIKVGLFHVYLGYWKDTHIEIKPFRKSLIKSQLKMNSKEAFYNKLLQEIKKSRRKQHI